MIHHFVPSVIQKIGGYAILAAQRKNINRFYQSTLYASETQRLVLNSILSASKGRKIEALFEKYGIHDADSFLKNLPLQTYDSLEPFLTDRDDLSIDLKNPTVSYIATSGTTGKPKIIPITKKCIQSALNGWKIWGWHYFREFPKLLNVPMLKISQPEALNLKMNDRTITTMTNIIADIQPWYVKRRYLPKRSPNSTHNDFERASYFDLCWREYIEESIPLPPIIMAANPASIAQWLQSKPHESVPMPTNIVTWRGGTMGHFAKRIESLIPKVSICDPGLIASEGRFTLGLGDPRGAGVLDIQAFYFEFLPLNKEISHEYLLPCHQLVTNETYEIVVTSYAGLSRYRMHDLVRCDGFLGTTPKLTFLQKRSEFCSLVGEKLSAKQVSDAIDLTEQKFGVSFDHAQLIPHQRDDLARLFYVLIVSPSICLEHQQKISIERYFDQMLCQGNMEYERKRNTGRLTSIEIVEVKREFFEEPLLRMHLQFKPEVLVSNLCKAEEILKKHFHRSF